jgi:L-seryl-tRNA(Ser) seleniumtransferase
MSDSHLSSKVTRRGFLLSQAALAAAAASPIPALAAANAAKPAEAVDYYDKLGVQTFLNASGTYTDLTSACMPDSVQEAVALAAKRWVHIRELQIKAGAYIADRLKCEGACISAGAASALTLGTAACLQAANNCKPMDIPRLMGSAQYPKNEVIVQVPYGYDEGMFMCGAKVVVVNTLDEYKKAFNENTVMTRIENAAEVVKIDYNDWLAVAHDHGVPCFLDAAADTPPITNLWKLTQAGWDLVCFSGGKGIRGPQSAGLLLGKKKYTDLAQSNDSPAEGVGRGMKVAKEQIVGMVAAVDWILGQTDDSLFKESRDRLAVISNMVKDIPTVKTSVIVPAIANHYPQLVIEFDPAVIGASPLEIKTRLATATPAIEINPHTGSTRASQGVDPQPNALVVTAMLLFPGQDEIVGRQIRSVLKNPKSMGTFDPAAIQRRRQLGE